MYQSEVNDREDGAVAVPEDVRAQWTDMSRGVTARSVIPWGEHCTECAIPHCFLTCDLYQPRLGDASCRRFSEGMVRCHGKWGVAPWLLKIHFKKWAKLWADGCAATVSMPVADTMERMNAWIGKTALSLTLPKLIKKKVMAAPWRFRNACCWWASKFGTRETPNYFRVEVYNPGLEPVGISLYIASRAPSSAPFVARFVLAPGLRRLCFPVKTIERHVHLCEPFYLEISPSESEARPLLYFGCVDFVQDDFYNSPRALGGCKCVVWDLDNTVWDGVLIENGADGVKVKAGIKEIFHELDRRGILLSVVSKNNLEDVIPALREHGLEEFILEPQVSWEPKGNSVRQIAQALSIGLDSIIYVDDSPFERAEVQAVCPEVTVIDATDAIWLPWREECQVPVTAESARRRSYYREQSQREEALEHSSSGYEGFLRECEIRVEILPLNETLLPRIHELAQRTNQMNFSGKRYTLEQLQQLCEDETHDVYAIDVKDRFGAYGIVGFAVVDRAQNTLSDLAFSCRIQAKRIEHAFLTFLLRRYPERPFRARWRKTSRNAPAAKVFSDVGFHEIGETDGVTRLEFDRSDIPEFDYILLESDTLCACPSRENAFVHKFRSPPDRR